MKTNRRVGLEFNITEPDRRHRRGRRNFKRLHVSPNAPSRGKAAAVQKKEKKKKARKGADKMEQQTARTNNWTSNNQRLKDYEIIAKESQHRKIGYLPNRQHWKATEQRKRVKDKHERESRMRPHSAQSGKAAFQATSKRFHTANQSQPQNFDTGGTQPRKESPRWRGHFPHILAKQAYQARADNSIQPFNRNIKTSTPEGTQPKEKKSGHTVRPDSKLPSNHNIKTSTPRRDATKEKRVHDGEATFSTFWQSSIPGTSRQFNTALNCNIKTSTPEGRNQRKESGPHGQPDSKLPSNKT